MVLSRNAERGNRMKIGLQTWGSDGDIRPILALAGGLRARGHQVSLVVSSVDNKDYSPYGKEMDFPISHVGKLEYDDKTVRLIIDKIFTATNPLAQVEVILAYYFNPLKAEMFTAAEQLCRENDAIIGHFLHYPLQTAAEKAGKPYATVMFNHGAIYSKHLRMVGVPDLGDWMKPYWWKLFHFLTDRSIGQEINSLRKSVGLPPVNKIADSIWTSDRLNLIAETSAICNRPPDWPEYHHVCGFFAVPGHSEKWSMPDTLKQFLEAGPPPVYMTLGSMFSLDPSPEIITEILVQAVLLAGCRTIIQAPWDTIQNIPDHPRIYKIRKTPHQFIFPHCAAVVHHGGAGTSHSATLHGCPSVVIEHFGDQQFFGDELQRLGIAPNVLHRKNLTAKKLAAGLRTVLSTPSMKERAEAVGAFMKKENGVQRAVELIEERLLPEVGL